MLMRTIVTRTNVMGCFDTYRQAAKRQYSSSDFWNAAAE